MTDHSPISCLVVDDEPLALQLVCDYIQRSPGLQLLQATTNPIEALQWVSEGGVELVFLDVQMPELSGMNFLKLAGGRCKTVLITAYEQYAVEGYQHDVVDYLLKPVTFERFAQTVQKVVRLLRPPGTVGPAQANGPEAPGFLFIKTEHKFQKINHADILYLEGLRDYVAIHTTAGKYLSLEPLRSFEERLPARQFIRIHKSYLVAVSCIDYIERSRVVIGGQFLPIGDTYKERVDRIISNH